MKEILRMVEGMKSNFQKLAFLTWASLYRRWKMAEIEKKIQAASLEFGNVKAELIVLLRGGGETQDPNLLIASRNRLRDDNIAAKRKLEGLRFSAALLDLEIKTVEHELASVIYLIEIQSEESTSVKEVNVGPKAETEESETVKVPSCYKDEIPIQSAESTSVKEGNYGPKAKTGESETGKDPSSLKDQIPIQSAESTSVKEFNSGPKVKTEGSEKGKVPSTLKDQIPIQSAKSTSPKGFNSGPNVRNEESETGNVPSNAAEKINP